MLVFYLLLSTPDYPAWVFPAEANQGLMPPGR